MADQGARLLALYERALPQVYGYLVPRTPTTAVAEDLTGETFLAAVSAVQRGTVPDLTVAWLVGVARHKLVDHWRRRAREERALTLASSDDVTLLDVTFHRSMKPEGVVAFSSDDHARVLVVDDRGGYSVFDYPGTRQ